MLELSDAGDTGLINTSKFSMGTFKFDNYFYTTFISNSAIFHLPNKSKYRLLPRKKANSTPPHRTINGECSLKNGQVLGDGRAFHHGSSRVRNVWEFERDPDDPKSLWQRWERKKHDKAHHRSDSMDCNVSAGEDRYVNSLDPHSQIAAEIHFHALILECFIVTNRPSDRMKLEADDDDGNSHGEGGKTVKDWPESTKKLKDSRFKVAEDTRKEQPAAGRKTVNHVLESPSSDGFSSDMDRTAVEESKYINYPLLPFLQYYSMN